MQIRFPFHIDGRGRSADADEDAHIRDLIEQVLFTNPGERVNRPTFGSGLLGLTFAPLDGALAATTQMAVQAALVQNLGDLIHVQAVQVDTEDSTLRVTVQYVIQRNQQPRLAQFVREV